MDLKVQDVYVRDSDKKVWRVKKIDGNNVLLESPDKKLTLTDIYGLARSYRKMETDNTGS